MSGVAVGAGYRLTDVGVIPEEWEVAPLSAAIVEFRGGASFKPSDFTKTGVKVLPKGGVGRSGYLQIAYEDPQYCTKAYADAHPRNQVDEKFTIVVLRDLVPSGPSIGLMVQIRNSETYVLAQGVYGFKVDERISNPGYLVQLSNSFWYRRLVNSIMVGSTQVHITNTAFKKAQIPLPPILEQRAIAATLSDMDALVSGLDQLITKKRDLKQTAMQQLLTGQRRLPGFKGAWQIQPLKSIIREFIVPMRDKPKGFRGNIPWCRIEDFDGKYLFGSKSNQCVDNDIIQKMNLKLFPVGTLLVSCSANLGRCAIVGSPLVSNQTFIGLVPDEKSSDSEFLFYLMTFNAGRLNLLSSGTTISYLSREQFESFEVIVPPSLGEQIEIAQLLSDMDSEIATLESRRAKTRDLKQGMMQELLTGRIRLV